MWTAQICKTTPVLWTWQPGFLCVNCIALINSHTELTWELLAPLPLLASLYCEIFYYLSAFWGQIHYFPVLKMQLISCLTSAITFNCPGILIQWKPSNLTKRWLWHLNWVLHPLPSIQITLPLSRHLKGSWKCPSMQKHFLISEKKSY